MIWFDVALFRCLFGSIACALIYLLGLLVLCLLIGMLQLSEGLDFGMFGFGC